MRKWWFESVLKLPRIARGYFAFGTVLHSVIERWLRADRTGRVPPATLIQTVETPQGPVWADGPLMGQRPGDAVELYPIGWETIVERGIPQSVNPQEAALIRRLVTKAIAEGVLKRYGDEIVEHAFRLPVIKGVELNGFIDVVTDTGITDHKSSKDRKYLKRDGPLADDGDMIPIGKPGSEKRSPNCVGDEQQMRTYAYAMVLEGHLPNDQVLLRHNQFLKTGEVDYAEAWITVEELEKHWAHIQEVAATMLELRTVKKWNDVPGPTSPNTCMAYGGCAFLNICGRVETPEMYRLRVDRSNGTIPTEQPTPEQGPMGKEIFQRKPGAAAPAPAASPVAINSPAPAPTKTIDVVATVVAAGPVAPWARPEGCRSCANTGINSSQNPCMICDSMAKKAGRPTSLDFVLAHDPTTGVLTWSAKPGVQQTAASTPAEQAHTVNTSPAQTPPPSAVEPAGSGAPAKPSPFRGRRKADASPMAAAVEAVKAVQEVAQERATMANGVPMKAAPAEFEQQLLESAAERTTEVTPEEPKGKRGPKKQGITLCVDCLPSGGATISLSELIAKYGALYAAEVGAPNYFECDTWKRRDALASRAAVIAAEIGSATVIASSSDLEGKSLLNALIPLAGKMYVGTR